MNSGTRVEVRDLFYATPARLKFLKSDRTEGEAVREVVRRLAMSRPDVAFTLAGEERAPVTWPAALPGEAGRLRAARRHARRGFPRQCGRGRGGRDGLHVEGFAALPTYTRANSLGQYLFVNGRPVRDKLLLGAVRAAYADYLPRDRHPVVALFFTLDPREVDVNVHPAKTEVRFRDAGLVRGADRRRVREALARESGRAATTGGDATSRGVPPGRDAARGGWDWRALARRAVMRRSQGNAALWVSPKPRRRPSTSARFGRRARVEAVGAGADASTGRSARPARRCTRPTSWRRPATASSSSTSTPRMSGWSTSG